MELPDVQSSLPEVRINLTRVGCKKRPKTRRQSPGPGNGRVIFISNFDVFVDLPGSLKGANLSRNFEVIDEVLQQAIDGEVKVNRGALAADGSAETPPTRHAVPRKRTEIRMRSQFMVRRETPVSADAVATEVVNVHASATRSEDMTEVRSSRKQHRR